MSLCKYNLNKGFVIEAFSAVQAFRPLVSTDTHFRYSIFEILFCKFQTPELTADLVKFDLQTIPECHLADLEILDCIEHYLA
jgi:hypothetical protein